MTREERETELYSLMRKHGLHPLIAPYMKATDMPMGQLLPIGITGSRMIETILEAEFPPLPPSTMP